MSTAGARDDQEFGRRRIDSGVASPSQLQSTFPQEELGRGCYLSTGGQRRDPGALGVEQDAFRRLSPVVPYVNAFDAVTYAATLIAEFAAGQTEG